jgi:hypothetical protein
MGQPLLLSINADTLGLLVKIHVESWEMDQPQIDVAGLRYAVIIAIAK